MTDNFIARSFIAIALVGAECGLAGVFIFLLNIPFVGVAIAHAAMAGGIWGAILGIPSKLMAFGFSFLSSLIIGPLSDKSKMNPNILLSIVFSTAMGIAFLGVGLAGSTKPVSNFLWGNILLISWNDIILVGSVLTLVTGVIVFYYRQYMAILFNREIAASLGINEKLFYYAMLFIIGIVVAVNLDAIGGLMLFSLIITPPAIAYQLTFNLKKFFVISAAAGVAGGCGGLAISYYLNWPASASVVLFTSALFIVAAIFSPKKRYYTK